MFCWALGEIAEPPSPDHQVDPMIFQDILPPFVDEDAPSFISRAKLCLDGDLLAKAEEVLGHHWEARNEKLGGSPPHIPMHIGILFERRQAIIWIISYGGSR